MSRDPRYQRLLNSRRWWEVKRIVWQRAGGLCEDCRAQGYVVPGVDCHHIVPVESATSPQAMERLAYDPNNCRLLCIPCHIKAHKEMRSHDTAELKANRQRRLDRWADQMQQRFGQQKNDNELNELNECAK